MKNLYEGSKYCYENSGTLKNKLDIRDYKQLEKYEAKITAAKSLGLRIKGITGDFDKKHYISIHKYLFEDIYPFAGEFREENIGKGEFRFASFEYIEPELDRLLNELKQENFLAGLSKQELAKRLAYYLSELNVLHPFREGNGRSQRLFIESLAKINGIYLDLTEVTKEDMIIASHESIKGNYHKLKEIFIKYSYALDDKEKLKYISDYCSDELKKIILNNK